MTVEIQAGSLTGEIGSSSFFNAFFSTVAVLLENAEPGSRFPVIGEELYEGHVDAENIGRAIAELQVIRAELMRYPPTAIVWDSEVRARAPPGGNDISRDISSMGIYFVTSDGRDLFDMLLEIFRYALKQKSDVDIA